MADPRLQPIGFRIDCRLCRTRLAFCSDIRVRAAPRDLSPITISHSAFSRRQMSSTSRPAACWSARDVSRRQYVYGDEVEWTSRRSRRGRRAYQSNVWQRDRAYQSRRIGRDNALAKRRGEFGDARILRAKSRDKEVRERKKKSRAHPMHSPPRRGEIANTSGSIFFAPGVCRTRT